MNMREEAEKDSGEDLSYNFGRFFLNIPVEKETRGKDLWEDIEYNCKKFEEEMVKLSNPLPSMEYMGIIFGTRIKMRGHTVLHEIDREANEKIKNTDIKFIPQKLPALLKDCFVVEAKDEKFLFGDVKAIFGFHEEEKIYVATMREIKSQKGLPIDYGSVFWTSDGELKGRNIKRFIKSLKGGLDVESVPSDLIRDKSVELLKDKNSKEILEKAVSYLLVLGYMLEAQKSPVEYKNKMKEERIYKDGKKKKRVWIIRYVQISGFYKKVLEEARRQGGFLDKEGKVQEEVNVRGYMRKVHYGEKRKESRIIWVDQFTRKQWVNEGNIKYIVKG